VSSCVIGCYFDYRKTQSSAPPPHMNGDGDKEKALAEKEAEVRLTVQTDLIRTEFAI